MWSVTNLLRTTALLSIVTTVKSVTSWDTAPKSNNSSTLIKRLTQPVNRVVGGNLDRNQGRDFNTEFGTNFENDKVTQTMLSNKDKQDHYLNPNFHPLNAFKCPPCVCKNISSNSVLVSCKRCSITSIPQSWPVEIDELIIEDCDRLEILDLRTLLMYTSLTRVKITSSLVKFFSSSRLNVSSTITKLDLSFNNIAKVEDKTFVILTNLLELWLSFNNLQILTKEMFTGLRSLRYLSVAYNNITYIANDTFEDMGNLVTLHISQNKIIYTGNDLLPVGIFIPLKNLEELYMNDLCKHKTYLCGLYPNKALQVLTKLRLLCIDGADSRGLGTEIKSLVQLRHLTISQPQSVNVTDESYFNNVQSITTLKFNFKEPHISPKLLAKLGHLINFTYYSFTGENEDLCKVLSDIKYLVNTSLKYLTFSNVNDDFTVCKELYEQQAIYLNLLHLTELDLSGDYLVYLSSDFIAMLPQTLQKIDLSGNYLSFEL